MSEPSLVALLASIRARLDALEFAALTEDDLCHLVAVDEWLTDLAPEEVRHSQIAGPNPCVRSFPIPGPHDPQLPDLAPEPSYCPNPSCDAFEVKP